MILNYFRQLLQARARRRHRLLNPGDRDQLTAALHVAAVLPDATADRMSALQAQLLERLVRRDRLGRLVVSDGTGRRLGRWWPTGEHRAMLAMAEEIVYANQVVRINGFGTIIVVVRDLQTTA